MNAAVLYQAAVGHRRVLQLSYVCAGRKDAKCGYAGGVWWSTLGPRLVGVAAPTALVWRLRRVAGR